MEMWGAIGSEKLTTVADQINMMLWFWNMAAHFRGKKLIPISVLILCLIKFQDNAWWKGEDYGKHTVTMKLILTYDFFLFDYYD